jgi:hypothetical protein
MAKSTILASIAIRDTSKEDAIPVRKQDFGTAIPVMANVGFNVTAEMEGCHVMSAMANASVNVVVEV